MTSCKHGHGEWIDGYWLCGQCYEKMEDVPYDLKWELGGSHDSDGPPRRQISVKRPTSEHATGHSLKSFIWAMAHHLIAATRGGFTQIDANDYAIEILKGGDVEFGDYDYDWTFTGAKELVYEDVKYWDFDVAGGNT